MGRWTQMGVMVAPIASWRGFLAGHACEPRSSARFIARNKRATRRRRSSWAAQDGEDVGESSQEGRRGWQVANDGGHHAVARVASDLGVKGAR